MKYNENEPTVQGKASILTTDVEITFYEKHQLDEALVFLVDNQYEFYFEVELGDSLKPDKYKLTVVSISWAYNVKTCLSFWKI